MNFCVRENVFIFRSPFFHSSLLLLLHVVYAYWTIADSRDFNRFASLCHWMMCDFLCNRVCTHTQNQIDNDFRQSIITFLLYIRPFAQTKISYKPSNRSYWVWVCASNCFDTRKLLRFVWQQSGSHSFPFSHQCFKSDKITQSIHPSIFPQKNLGERKYLCMYEINPYGTCHILYSYLHSR